MSVIMSPFEVPETKDRSLGEIEEHFRNGQGLRLNVIKVMMVMVMVMVGQGLRFSKISNL